MSSEQNEYILGRGYLPAMRLNAQHLYWREQQGYDIHPSIPKNQGMRVADVGTGTGIWLIQASKVLPDTAVLDGFDIDVSQAPPKGWLPTNVSVSAWDAFSDVPPDLIGKYDVVHVAVLVLIIAKNNPHPLLENLLKLLKPGGFIQWDEFDWTERHFVKADESLSTAATKALLDYVYEWERATGPKTWIRDLATTYASLGLENIIFERFHMAREYLRYLTDISLASYEEFSKAVLDPRGKGEGQKMRELLAKAFDESRRGVSMPYDKVVVVGQKPK